MDALVIERSSRLARPADEVWARVTTVVGINDELGPWMRMTVPRGWSGSSIGDVRPGSTLGRSWVLLFGVIPIDYDDLGITAVGDRSFREDSSLGSARSWRHERWVEPDVGGADGRCVLRDRIEFVPRRWITWLPGGLHGHRAVVRAIFAHRHHRLLAWSATV